MAAMSAESEHLLPRDIEVSSTAFPAPTKSHIAHGTNQGMIFSRSPSLKLVAYIVAIKCANCSVGFSSVRLPLTAHCGHHFCPECARQVTMGSGNSGDVNLEAYNCVACKKVVSAPVAIGGSSSFSPNAFLAGVFKALDEGGYRCMFCAGYHPRNNAVVCQRRGVPAQFACVWCAANAGTEHDLRLITDNHYCATVADRNQKKLLSVDRSVHSESAASGLLHCSFCAGHLVAPKSFMRSRDLAFQLPCGHYQHLNCNCPGGKSTFCKLCPKVIDFSVVDKKGVVVRQPNASVTARPMQTKTLIEAAAAMGDLKTCERCKDIHSIDNFDQTGKKCVWCAIEAKWAN